MTFWQSIYGLNLSSHCELTAKCKISNFVFIFSVTFEVIAGFTFSQLKPIVNGCFSFYILKSSSISLSVNPLGSGVAGDTARAAAVLALRPRSVLELTPQDLQIYQDERRGTFSLEAVRNWSDSKCHQWIRTNWTFPLRPSFFWKCSPPRQHLSAAIRL